MLTTTDIKRLIAYKRRYVSDLLGFEPGTIERLRFLAWLRANGKVSS